MPDENFKEEARKLLTEMLRLMEVDSTVEIQGDEDNFKLAIQSSGDAGRLIGKKGQTLESLELVLNRILKKHETSEERLPWVSLDVDGYTVEPPEHEHERPGKLPHAEIERLQALAKDIGKEVKKLRVPRIIGPYSPAERRIIHLTLEHDPDVETVSDPEADQNRGKKITVKLRETPLV